MTAAELLAWAGLVVVVWGCAAGLLVAGFAYVKSDRRPS